MENMEDNGKSALQNILNTRAINDKEVEKKEGIGPEDIFVISSDALQKTVRWKKNLKLRNKLEGCVVRENEFGSCLLF